MTSAVWMRVRADLRNHWRAWVLLALVIGVVFGAALTAAAGARRADSAYPRFTEEYKAYDVVLGGIAADPPEAARIRKRIISFPEVADYATGEFVSSSVILPSGTTVSFPEAFVVGDPTGHEGFRVNKAKVLEGRLFDRAAKDEAVVDFNFADRFRLGVGDVVRIPLGESDSDRQEIAHVRIVGVAIAPQSIPAVGQADLAGIEVSPAFVRAHAAAIPPSTDAPSLRLKHGIADLPSLLARIKTLSSEIDVPLTSRTRDRGVRKTLRYEVQALWILSALIGLAGIAILGQAISRQITTEAGDNPVLRSLGMSPQQLIAAGMVRATGAALLAAIVALVTAILASPLTPIGLTRLMEPDPGVRVDLLVMFGGASIVFVVVLLISALPVIRTARARARGLNSQVSRPSRAAALAAEAGAGPSAVTGLRLALETGRGARAIPVRSALLGLTVAIASFAAAGTFTTSLDHLIAKPALYGYGWDFITVGDSTAQTRRAIGADPDLEAVTRGGAANIKIGSTHLIPFAYMPGRGIAPTILDGRAPIADDEIALGTSLLKTLHTRVGGTIRVRAEPAECGAPPAKRMRVVGSTVVPTFFFQAVEPGQSSAITLPGVRRLVGKGSRCDHTSGTPLVVRYKDGTSIDAKLSALQKKIPGLFTIQVRRSATELSAVSRSSGVPLTLTEVLLLMAVATLIHVLVTSVRRRRHDLAILKSMGFVRAQVRGAVAWQATTLTLVALVLGLPTGIAIGRTIWTAFADSIGVVPEPAVRVLVMVITVPAAILVANIIAALPARAAAATKPALILREE